MTCHRVPLTPSLCTCGAVLDITQWHDDDEQGNPLCPTCSGCGCEPNERNLMNKRTPRGVIADAVFAWKDGESLADMVLKSLRYAGYEIIERPVEGEFDDEPVPEPDHSMCARLVQDGAFPDGRRGWALKAPDKSTLWFGDDDVVRDLRFAIPEPEPTVEERLAQVVGEVMAAHSEPSECSLTEDLVAAVLASGLVRDGEQ